MLAFTLEQSHGRPSLADPYLLAALLVCAAGYAEGGRLASPAGWQVIAWGIVAAGESRCLRPVALPAEPLRRTA